MSTYLRADMVDTVNCNFRGYDWAKFWDPIEQGSYKEQPDEDAVKLKHQKEKRRKRRRRGSTGGNTS